MAEKTDTTREEVLEARLESELTRYLEAALGAEVPPQLLELARALQQRLKERET